MARLSAENSAEHLAALKTPEPKTSKKSSRFKDFFKVGYSRTSLSSGHNPSPSNVSPLGGAENLEPGFEKVGVYPSERLQIVDLDEWEKLKEESTELGYSAKIKLYKEREEMKRREGEEGTEVVELGERSRNGGEKAMRVLGIDDAVIQKKSSADDTEMTAAKDENTAAAEDIARKWELERHKEDAAYAKAESLRKACDDSSSRSSIGSLTDVGSDAVILGALRPIARVNSKSDNPKIDSDEGPVTTGYLSLHHSPPLTNLRSNAQNQIHSDDSISSIHDSHLNQPTRADTSVSLEQQISDAVHLHEFRFHRFGLADVSNTHAQSAHLSAASHIRSKIFAELGVSPSISSPATKTFKLGPYTLDDFTATALRRYVVRVVYLPQLAILFFKAIQGPDQAFIVVWRLVVMLCTYEGVRRFMGWDEDGSSDVLLVAAEGLAAKTKDCGTKMMGTILKALAHAIAVALRDFDSEGMN